MGRVPGGSYANNKSPNVRGLCRGGDARVRRSSESPWVESSRLDLRMTDSRYCCRSSILRARISPWGRQLYLPRLVERFRTDPAVRCWVGCRSAGNPGAKSWAEEG